MADGVWTDEGLAKMAAAFSAAETVNITHFVLSGATLLGGVTIPFVLDNELTEATFPDEIYREEVHNSFIDGEDGFLKVECWVPADIDEDFFSNGIGLIHREIEVSGTTSPDFDGTFTANGQEGGVAAYSNIDGAGYLWWDGTDSWIISAVLGTEGTDYFKRTDPNPVGAYTNEGSATGTVTAAEEKTLMAIAQIPLQERFLSVFQKIIISLPFSGDIGESIDVSFRSEDAVTLAELNSHGHIMNQTVVNFAASPYNVLVPDDVLLVDCSGGDVVINFLPSATGKKLICKRIDSAPLNKAEYTPDGAETIEGFAASYDSEMPKEFMTFLPDGFSAWWRIG